MYSQSLSILTINPEILLRLNQCHQVHMWTKYLKVLEVP